MTPVLPTSYFGSIAYFRVLSQYDNVLIEGKEHFPKQTYRNRCDIVGGDGILSLSIPTKKPDGSKTLTEDILLSNDENWRARHWRSLKSAYQSAAYFDFYGIEVEELLFAETTSLLDFNTAITKRIIHWLDLDTVLAYSSEFKTMEKDDYRRVLLEKNAYQDIQKAPYIQVFPGPTHYKESLSILDAIFCEGPLARNLLIAKH
jgi:hypothetical protein